MSPNLTIRLPDGRNMGYAEFGNPKGKPIFFFHGWPASRFHALRMDQPAKELGIRLIAPDRPGVGNSDFQYNRTLLDYPRDIITLADHLHIARFSVIGVSGGGPYAAVCAYAYPKRIKRAGIVVGLAPTYIPGILDGMGILNKLGWANYHMSALLRNMATYIHLVHVRYVPFLIKLVYRSKEDREMMSKEMIALYLKSAREALKQGIRGLAWDLKLYTADWKFNVRDIKTRVYLWYGDADKNVSLAMGKYYKEQIPNSKLVIYKGEGHFLQIPHAKEILRALTAS